MKIRRTRQYGFSLVELSIVLVILGLLTGGILSGQSLIRAAEIRSVITEYQRYATATTSFRDKYFAIPGDMRNATAFWGDDNTYCPDAAVANGTPGTCNGDSNGRIERVGTTGTTTQELFQFWKQLALAGLIEGNYTGIAGSSNSNDSTIGTNTPRSRISNGGWNVNFPAVGVYPGDPNSYAIDYGNMFFLGSPIATVWSSGPLLKPEELWNIDTKLDDGKPGIGKIIARDAIGFGVTGSCTTSASGTVLTGDYNLVSSTVACAFFAVKAF